MFTDSDFLFFIGVLALIKALNRKWSAILAILCMAGAAFTDIMGVISHVQN